MISLFKAKQDSILPSPSNALLDRTQKYYRVRFPSEYVEFLRQNNGAIPISNQFTLDSHCYLIERFLCLLDDEIRDELDNVSWSEIRVVITQLDGRLVDDEDLVGMNVIPIAILFAGDYVCLDYRKSVDRPTICIWYHEESSEFAPTTKFLADSFEQFLEALVE